MNWWMLLLIEICSQKKHVRLMVLFSNCMVPYDRILYIAGNFGEH